MVRNQPIRVQKYQPTYRQMNCGDKTGGSSSSALSTGTSLPVVGEGSYASVEIHKSISQSLPPPPKKIQFKDQQVRF